MQYLKLVFPSSAQGFLDSLSNFSTFNFIDFEKILKKIMPGIMEIKEQLESEIQIYK